MKRLFCAVKVPYTEAIGRALADFHKALEGENIRWVDPENLHITLKFFGSTPLRSLEGIKDALHKAAANCPPFAFNVEGCGTFGSVRMPKVIWLGINNESGLSKLYDEVNQHLLGLDYTPDKSIFSPHLTIGRVKDLSNTQALFNVEGELQTQEFSQVEVNRFYLFESLLQPHGPEYKVVEAFDLGEGHRA